MLVEDSNPLPLRTEAIACAEIKLNVNQNSQASELNFIFTLKRSFMSIVFSERNNMPGIVGLRR